MSWVAGAPQIAINAATIAAPPPSGLGSQSVESSQANVEVQATSSFSWAISSDDFTAYNPLDTSSDASGYFRKEFVLTPVGGLNATSYTALVISGVAHIPSVGGQDAGLWDCWWGSFISPEETALGPTVQSGPNPDAFGGGGVVWEDYRYPYEPTAPWFGSEYGWLDAHDLPFRTVVFLAPNLSSVALYVQVLCGNGPSLRDHFNYFGDFLGNATNAASAEYFDGPLIVDYAVEVVAYGASGP